MSRTRGDSLRQLINVCRYKDCWRKHLGRGYCKFHYERLRTGRDLDMPRKIRDPNRGCKAEGCLRKHFGLGYCAMHKERFKRGIPMDKPIEIHDSSRKCGVDGCKRKHFGKGYCRNHYLKIESPNTNIRMGDHKVQQVMREVKIRDGVRCKWSGCLKSGKNGDRIEAHHIFPISEYPELRYEKRYMISYCKPHHDIWHSQRKVFGSGVKGC